MIFNITKIDEFIADGKISESRFVLISKASRTSLNNLRKSGNCTVKTLLSFAKTMNIHPGELFEYEEGEEHWAGDFSVPEQEPASSSLSEIRDERVLLLKEKVELKEETIAMLREKVKMLEEKLSGASW